MKAAVLHEVGRPLVIEDVDVKKPGPHEVLIRTAYAGLCHSDLHFIEGLYPHPLPMVLGHESAGIVDEVGSEVTYVKKGDHIITCLSVFCGTCENCTAGRPVICVNTDVKTLPGQARRLTMKGSHLNTGFNLSSFAEMMLVHENAIVKIDKGFPLDRAALIGCGVITGFGAVVNTANVAPGETVAIIGCGGVGMAAVNGAAVAGAGRIFAVDTNPVKLQLAAKIGATDLINPRDGDPVERIRAALGGNLPTACITRSSAWAPSRQPSSRFRCCASGALRPSWAWCHLEPRSNYTASTSCVKNAFRVRPWAVPNRHAASDGVLQAGQATPRRLHLSPHQAERDQRRLRQHESR